MTVMAAEVIPAAETAGTGTAASAASKAAPRTGGRTSQGARQQPRKGGRSQQGTQGDKNVKPEVIEITRDEGGEERTVRPVTMPQHSWHRWIIAEFAASVVMVGASPFLRPGGPAANAPSLARPLIRLTAVSALFFILALAGTGPRSGKVAAAFGGLVTLGIAFNSLPEFTTLGQMFGAKTEPKPLADESAPMPLTMPPAEGQAP